MKHLKTLAAIIAGLWYCMNVSATTDNLPNDTEGYTENGFLWEFRVDSYTSTASLYVYGDGAMDNYTSSSRSPWSSYLKYVDYIEIGGDVTSIGDYAFAIVYDNDTKLKNISMPSTLTSIGKSAFSNICATTPLVVIPEGVTNIGDDAFYNIGKRNNKFARVVLPSTLKSIGNYAFYCNAGTDEDSYWIDVYSLANTPPSISSNTFYISDNEDAVVYCPNPSAYSTWLGGEYLGGDAKSMPFSSYGINDYTLENNIDVPILTTHTGIQFWGYKNGVLHLYQTGKSISAYNNINRNNVSSIRIQGYDITSIADSAFYGYTNLKSIEIPSTVVNIHSSAFEGCISLKTVTIPDDCALLSISEKAFSGCQSLTSFTIPGSVVGLQSNSFEGCFFAHSNFVNNSIYVNEYTAGATIYSGKEYDGLFIFDKEILAARPQLTSVNIPDFVTCIGDKAFYECSKLSEITIPCSVKTIEEEAFYKCSSLTNLVIPNSVTNIKEKAFGFCTNLKNIEIPTSVNTIGVRAFDNCVNLSSITIPEGVTRIEDSAFNGCNKLESAVLPNTLKFIAKYAFGYCNSLNSIIIPCDVTEIESSAFYGCTSLKTVINYSELDIQKGETTHGRVAYYADEVINYQEPINLTDSENYENTEDTENVTVTYTRTLPNLYWNALYLPFEIPVEQLIENYDVAYFNDVHSYDYDNNGTIDKLDMEVIQITNGTLKANYPYLIRAKNEEAKQLYIEVKNTTLYAAEENTVSCSSVFMRFDITGTYSQMTSGDLNGSLVVSTDGTWKQLKETSKLKPYRLYLTLTTLEGAPVKLEEILALDSPLVTISLRGEEGTTGVENYFENRNQSSESRFYDLMGRPVYNPVKGHIYIKNGRKILY